MLAHRHIRTVRETSVTIVGQQYLLCDVGAVVTIMALTIIMISLNDSKHHPPLSRGTHSLTGGFRHWLKFNASWDHRNWGSVADADNLLTSGLKLNYLMSTFLAVEMAVLHNFVWHERLDLGRTNTADGRPQAPAANTVSPDQRRDFDWRQSLSDVDTCVEDSICTISWPISSPLEPARS